MDRVEKRASPFEGAFAKQGQVDEGAAPLLETPEGRNDDRGLSDRGTDMDADVRNVPVGVQPRSAVTGRHDPGSGANETVDGLDAIEEETRAFAEDIPEGGGPEDHLDELPAFERGMTAPRV